MQEDYKFEGSLSIQGIQGFGYIVRHSQKHKTRVSGLRQRDGGFISMLKAQYFDVAWIMCKCFFCFLLLRRFSKILSSPFYVKLNKGLFKTE